MASILLLNSSLQNKGDALMFRAVEEKFGPEHHWSVPTNVAAVSWSQTRGMSMCMLSDLPGFTTKQSSFNHLTQGASAALRMLPGTIRRSTGLLTPADIDVAFDMSGYCFGDFWGQERVDQCTRNYRELKQGGAKVILMPKSWGPFETISSESLNRMFRYVDLAFARDASSFEAITKVLGPEQRAKVHFAPDYTHEVQPTSNKTLRGAGERTGWIIPNSHVVSSGTMTRDSYLQLLSLGRELFEKASMKPMLLIHESSNDLRFVTEAEKMGFGKSDVVIARDAVHAKALISTGSAVISSALHGAYNALNSIVPVAIVPAIPWQYKYAYALEHYGCPECLVDMSNPEESLRTIAEVITDLVRAEELRYRIRKGRDDQQAHTAAMWQRIYEITDLRPLGVRPTQRISKGDTENHSDAQRQR